MTKRPLKYDQNLHILIANDQRQALQTEAEHLGIGLSAYLRLIINKRQPL